MLRVEIYMRNLDLHHLNKEPKDPQTQPAGKILENLSGEIHQGHANISLVGAFNNKR